MHGLEEAKLDGAALKRNQTSDEGDVCHDVLFENLGQPYILSSNPVKSARASDFEREIGLILKRFTFFFFFHPSSLLRRFRCSISNKSRAKIFVQKFVLFSQIINIIPCPSW